MKRNNVVLYHFSLICQDHFNKNTVRNLAMFFVCFDQNYIDKREYIYYNICREDMLSIIQSIKEGYV